MASAVEQASAQCKAEIKNKAAQMKWQPGDFRCDDFSSYACERRIFSPDIETMSHALKECLPGDTICVDVDIRQYNTSTARDPASDKADFTPGGIYNHEEVRCYHRWLYKGVAIFEGDQATLEESLSEAMSACDRAWENP